MQRWLIAPFVIVALATTTANAQSLGPKDGAGLAPADTARVAVGSAAPDFSLAAFDGSTVTLSDFRGRKNVVLVYYRGHW